MNNPESNPAASGSAGGGGGAGVRNTRPSSGRARRTATSGRCRRVEPFGATGIGSSWRRPCRGRATSGRGSVRAPARGPPTARARRRIPSLGVATGGGGAGLMPLAARRRGAADTLPSTDFATVRAAGARRDDALGGAVLRARVRAGVVFAAAPFLGAVLF